MEIQKTPLPVSRPPGDHPTHPTARVGNIARPPGNHMDVRMTDGLTGNGAIVDANIYAAHCRHSQSIRSNLRDDGPDRLLLLFRKIK